MAFDNLPGARTNASHSCSRNIIYKRQVLIHVSLLGTKKEKSLCWQFTLMMVWWQHRTTAQDHSTADGLIQELKKEFEITQTDVSVYVGLQIKQKSDGSIFLCQSAYADKIVNKFRLSDANPVSIPADPHQKDDKVDSEDNLVETTAPYREAIGNLMCLAMGTRPDITFAVNRASRHMENPTKLHWNAVKRIFKYIKGTSGYGLTFSKDNPKDVKAFSDADYANDVETRKSTTGYVILWGSSVISWCSQRQSVVTLSTTDAEYIAACQTAREIMWVKKLLNELCNKEKQNITLFMDNQSAIQLIKNPVYHKRTKHIDVKYHYVRDMHLDGNYDLDYVITKEQVADILTKPLPRQLFQRHCGVWCSNN